MTIKCIIQFKNREDKKPIKVELEIQDIIIKSILKNHKITLSTISNLNVYLKNIGRMVRSIWFHGNIKSNTIMSHHQVSMVKVDYIFKVFISVFTFWFFFLNKKGYIWIVQKSSFLWIYKSKFKFSDIFTKCNFSSLPFINEIL